MFHVHSVGTWAGTRVTTAVTGSTINDGVHFGYDDGYGAYVWNREATAIIFATSNTERARFNPSGYFGIGTASPSKRLDVAGSVVAGNSISLGKGVTDYAGIGFNRDVETGAIFAPAYSAYQIHREVNGNKLVFQSYTGTGAFLGHPLAIDGMNVGVGTLTPGHRLDVAGNVNGSGLCIAGVCKTDWSQVGGGGTGSSQWANSGSNIYFSSGSVGIGTNAPALPLDLRAAAARVARFTGTAAAHMGVQIDAAAGWNSNLIFMNGGQERWYLGNRAGSDRFSIIESAGTSEVLSVTQNGRVGIGTTAPATALHVAGDITATGNIAAKYQDVAEWVPSVQKLAAGTVVVLDTGRPNHVLASAAAYDTKAAGVISEQPGVILGVAGEGKVMVATTGRVRVRVDATRGAIRIGDLLVTGDAEGVAMKSLPVDLGGTKFHRPGTIIGKALEPLENGVGMVLVLLSLQ